MHNALGTGVPLFLWFPEIWRGGGVIYCHWRESSACLIMIFTPFLIGQFLTVSGTLEGPGRRRVSWDIHGDVFK